MELVHAYQRGFLAALIGMVIFSCWEVLFLLDGDCETLVVLDLLTVTPVNQIEDLAVVAIEDCRSPIGEEFFQGESPPCPLLLYPGALCCSTAPLPASSVAEHVVWSL